MASQNTRLTGDEALVYDPRGVMSLQINLSSKEIYDAYQNVLNAKEIDWAIFTYEKGTNDLKVQATGNGGLEELEEEFSDGRCVFVRSCL
jgi:hypothetical protein